MGLIIFMRLSFSLKLRPTAFLTERKTIFKQLFLEPKASLKLWVVRQWSDDIELDLKASEQIDG